MIERRTSGHRQVHARADEGRWGTGEWVGEGGQVLLQGSGELLRLKQQELTCGRNNSRQLDGYGS